MAAEVMKTPVSWGVWLSGLMAGVALEQVLPLMGVAAGAQMLLVARAMNNPETVSRALRTQRIEEARQMLQCVQEDAARIDGATRERIQRILSAYEVICRESAARDVPRYAHAPLNETVAQMGHLATRAFELATRRGELAAGLEGISRSELAGQQASLRIRGERADDPMLKTQIEQSLRFKEEEIIACDAIQLAIRRIDGQLESVECAFAALKARVLRFKSDEKIECAAAGEELHEEIDTLTGQIDVLDQSVGEALALRRRA